MEWNLKKILKSAMAFFFLFFLHGTSIGNGQQGISYNKYMYAIIPKVLILKAFYYEFGKYVEFYCNQRNNFLFLIKFSNYDSYK